MAATEDFAERYTNVALASWNSSFFIPCNGTVNYQFPPFYLNQRCYTMFLVDNELPYRWRHQYNEDTDMTLQVLADGFCTMLFNAFLIKTRSTNINSTNTGGEGGGQAAVYDGDGRLKMARDLERVWPGVVSLTRRFDRPQHKVIGQWNRFDNKLIKREDLDVKPGKNEYGMRMVATEPPKSKIMRQVLKDNQEARANE